MESVVQRSVAELRVVMDSYVVWSPEFVGLCQVVESVRPAGAGSKTLRKMQQTGTVRQIE
jgi:hypothetical protein